MRKKFFIKNLIKFSISLLIPLIILGVSSTLFTRRHIKQQIDVNNVNMLNQIKSNIEMVFHEIESLNLSLSTNPAIVVRLKKILSNPYQLISGDDYFILNTIIDLIRAPVNSNHYIDSLYIHFGNEMFITSTGRISKLSDFYDTSWLENIKMIDDSVAIWTEMRDIKQYEFQHESKRVLTIYRRLYSSGIKKSTGMLVLNVDIEQVNTLFDSLEISPSQSIFVLNQNNDIIFNNSNTAQLSHSDLAAISNSPLDFFNMTSTHDETYMVSKLFHPSYHWKYIFVVSRDELYHLPNQLFTLTTVLVAISSLLAILLSYFLAKRNYDNIKNILSIIDSAQSEEPLPTPSSTINDEYGYIIHNLLKTFIEHDYLQVQLSQRKYRIQALELLALQSQINPHFLYNTLETIYWKTMTFTGKPNSLTKMIENLSDILRYSLHNAFESVELEMEINATKSYLDIQMIRYKEKFSVIWEIDDTVKSCMVPKLLMQPLVENCIYHGIKEKTGSAVIKLKLFDIGDKLKISIIDNGVGISTNRLAEVKKMLKEYENDQHDHIGLFNTNKRIKLAYGEQYGVKIMSKQGLGTAVHLYLPKMTKPHNIQYVKQKSISD